jgi:hypothetical protein
VKLANGVSLIGSGQNLLDDTHPEFTNSAIAQTLVRRSAHVQVAWRF